MARFALIQNGTVWEISPDRNLWTADQDVRDLTSRREVKLGWKALGNGFYEAPPAPDAVPPVTEVSSAQAKIQLLRSSYLVPVKESVAALGGEVEIWFNDARTWQRNNPHVVSLGAGLGLSKEEIDGLFRDAALIDA